MTPIDDEIDQVSKISKRIRRTKDGDYTTLVYRIYKKLGKEWNPRSLSMIYDYRPSQEPYLITKWARLLGPIAPKYRARAAQILELEITGIMNLSDNERAEQIGSNLKYVFPSVVRYFSSKKS